MNREPADQRIGGYVIGVLTTLILIGLAVDAFIQPLWWVR